MSKRGKKLRQELTLFLQRYARKKRKGGLDPNDRRYDRKIAAMVRRLRPEEFDALLQGDEE